MGFWLVRKEARPGGRRLQGLGIRAQGPVRLKNPEVDGL